MSEIYDAFCQISRIVTPVRQQVRERGEKTMKDFLMTLTLRREAEVKAVHKKAALYESVTSATLCKVEVKVKVKGKQRVTSACGPKNETVE